MYLTGLTNKKQIEKKNPKDTNIYIHPGSLSWISRTPGPHKPFIKQNKNFSSLAFVQQKNLLRINTLNVYTLLK